MEGICEGASRRRFNGLPFWVYWIEGQLLFSKEMKEFEAWMATQSRYTRPISEAGDKGVDYCLHSC